MLAAARRLEWPHSYVSLDGVIPMSEKLVAPKVIVTRHLPMVVEDRLADLFNAKLNLTDEPMSEAQLIEAVQTADILLPTVTDRINAKVIEAAGPQLKLIANFGAGVDHIDVEAAHKKGIIVTNTPGVLTDDTADLTMALILAVPRRLSEGVRTLREGNWHGWSPTWMLGHRVSGKKLGIIGMGRIGQAVAKRARAFGMQINYHNRQPVHPDIAEPLEANYWDSLDQMLAHMDIVSLHCPHTPATYHLLSRRRLSLLSPHAYLVNTARGNIVDETALVDLLEQGAIAGAGLDVFEHEPAVDPRLIDMPNVTLLPHMGSSTMESRVAMGERTLINIKTWVDGHRPPDRILPS